MLDIQAAQIVTGQGKRAMENGGWGKSVQRVRRPRMLVVLPWLAVGLAACGTGNGVKEGATAAAAATTGRLVLKIEGAETRPDGKYCAFGVTASNDTGAAALNVQAAWMAGTDGFGYISDYLMLGDFAAGEKRSLQLGVAGAPCNAVRELTLTRTVCVVGPAQDPPRSCAALVALDGGKVVAIGREK